MAHADYNDPTYDYTKYWNNREYEHLSERMALNKLLETKDCDVIDIGGGFGRLIPVLKNFFPKITVFDYSSKLLELAKQNSIHEKVNVDVAQGDIYQLSSALNGKKFDYAVMIRVCHHLKDFDKAISEISKSLNSGATLILEFANKLHFKSVLKHLLKGDFSYFSKDPISVSAGEVAFYNFHPAYVKEVLKKNGFEVEKGLSVSNFRSPFLKKIIPLPLLLFKEHLVQQFLYSVSFGPSIFLKCRKK
jgi:ubiquinone/menaquinone biosynthesis C-methylase UbiE